MAENRLNISINALKRAWGPLNSETVANCRSVIADLAQASGTELWLRERLKDTPGYVELYRDPEAGFVLFAYLEVDKRYREPHDHGSGWVIYAVVSGEVEMGTYLRTVNPQGQLELVNRDLTRMQAGDCNVYLPGDIHDTRGLSESALFLRFTSCDLEIETRQGRMIRYPEQGEIIEKKRAAG